MTIYWVFFLVAWNHDKFSKWSQHINSASRISGLCKRVFFLYLWSLFLLSDVSPRLIFFKFKYFQGWNVPNMEIKASHTVTDKGAIYIQKGIQIFCFSLAFQLPKKKKSDEKNSIIPIFLNTNSSKLTDTISHYVRGS